MCPSWTKKAEKVPDDLVSEPQNLSQQTNQIRRRRSYKVFQHDG